MMSKFGFVAAHVYCNLLMTYAYLELFDCKRMVRFVSAADSLRILTLLVPDCIVVWERLWRYLQFFVLYGC